MSRYSQRVLDYFADHAIDPAVAEALGVEDMDGIGVTIPYSGGFRRTRDFAEKITRQPKGRALELWCPVGTATPPGAERPVYLLLEGESDCLAAVSALGEAEGAGVRRRPDLPTSLRSLVPLALPGAGTCHAAAVELAKEKGAPIIVALDADDAGRRASEKLRQRADKAGVQLRAVELPEGADLADVLAAAADPTAALAELVAGAEVEAEAVEAAPEPPSASTLTPFSEIVAKPVRFLWQDRIALGKITALAGRPKIGKGLLYSHLIAEVTRGTLDGDVDGPRRAIIVTTEDEPGDTLKPRLMAAGADLTRVSYFTMGSADEPVPFRVPQDAAELGRRVAETGAALIVVDPLMEFIDGKTDTHKSQPVRQAVAALNAIAREHGCAVLVVFHLNKAPSNDPLLRHEGSAAFTQIVRAALMLGFDPEDPEGEEGDQRVLAVSASNLAGLATSLVYKIDGARVEGDTGEPITTAAMRYIGESSAASHDLLGGREDDEDRADRDEAVDFLRAELEDGPRSASEIKRAANAAAVGPGALKRAKRDLRVESHRQGFGGKGGWEWRLPDESPKGDAPKGTVPLSVQPSPLTPLGSRAKSDPSKGDGIAKGDGPTGTSPLGGPGARDATVEEEAEVARVASKFGGAA